MRKLFANRPYKASAAFDSGGHTCPAIVAILVGIKHRLSDLPIDYFDRFAQRKNPPWRRAGAPFRCAGYWLQREPVGV